MYRIFILIICFVLLVFKYTKGEDVIITAPGNLNHGIAEESRATGLLVAEGIKNAIDTVVGFPDTVGRDGRSLCNKKKKKGKHKHTKYLIPLVVGWLLIKSIIIPVALKGLALLSGGSVVLSLMSLVLVAIMGLRRLIAGFSLPTPFSATAPSGYSKYKRKDQMEEDLPYEPADPYKYYRDKYDNNGR